MKIMWEINPARLLISGYIIIILIGAILLSLPFATTRGISFIDALFTSTSAVCVTGLIVKNTALDFTLWGKLIILILIQIGGLGYMTLSTTFFYFLGKKISLHERILFKESLNLLNYENLMRFAWRVLRITIVLELIGTVLYYIEFSRNFSPLVALGHSIFHSVSSFCNAGFSTFSENLSFYSNSKLVPLTCAILLIIGGIGFVVISDIYYVLIKRTKKGLALHTKMVLKTTVFLVLFGTIFIFLTEGNTVLKNYPLDQKIINSFFHAVTPRTAGFNTVDISLFSSPTIFLIIIFMFIGASPGGTGGGVKTTTIMLLWKWVKELLLGNYNNITIMKKRIPHEQVFRAFLLIFSSGLLIFLCFFVVLIIERTAPLKLLFEMFSAFGTVGLSLGSDMNPFCNFSFDLSIFGKLAIIFLMICGRVGTLTLSHTLIRAKPREFIYPEESIIVG
ncbi:MAG: TrkH family potassium uptake protein [candidate division WOR-3 bacterium]